MVHTRRGLPFLSIFLLCLVLFSLLTAGRVSAGAVTFSKARISTQSGEEETEFVFTVTVTSGEEPQDAVEVVVENKGHIMREIDPNDTNFSDGKEFQYKGRFGEGPKFYFFRCGNITTRACTFEVKEFRFFEEYHPDLLFAMAIYVVPVLYILILLNRLRKNTAVISETLRTVVTKAAAAGGTTNDRTNRVGAGKEGTTNDRMNRARAGKEEAAKDRTNRDRPNRVGIDSEGGVKADDEGAWSEGDRTDGERTRMIREVEPGEIGDSGSVGDPLETAGRGSEP